VGEVTILIPREWIPKWLKMWGLIPQCEWLATKHLRRLSTTQNREHDKIEILPHCGSFMCFLPTKQRKFKQDGHFMLFWVLFVKHVVLKILRKLEFLSKSFSRRLCTGVLSSVFCAVLPRARFSSSRRADVWIKQLHIAANPRSYLAIELRKIGLLILYILLGWHDMHWFTMVADCLSIMLNQRSLVEREYCVLTIKMIGVQDAIQRGL
jgi:hypothetical protein